MTAPLCSVVIPTYRRPGWLREAIESVRAQTLGDWECLVVDAGADPETRAVVAEQQADARIRYLSCTSCGNPGVTRNAGAAAATGQWLAFLDDDDLWLPGKLERQLDAAAERPGAALHCTQVQRFGGDDALWPSRPLPSSLDFDLLLDGNEVACSTVLCRRAFFVAVGGFDETLRICEDYELWLRLARRESLAFLAEPLCRYRVHPGGASARERDLCLALLAVYRLCRSRGWITRRAYRRRARHSFDRLAAAEPALARRWRWRLASWTA